jgi:LPXTG-motif cell wall-anchored protein
LSFAQDLPRVELECPSDSVRPATPFELRVIVSWEGDAESHVIVPPEPVFPESFSLRSSSFEATVRNSLHQLIYRFMLVPRQTGRFTIYPVDIRCWPRGSSAELSLVTDTCVVTVEHTAWLPQKNIWAAAAGIMIIIAVGFYLSKKRTAFVSSSAEPVAEANCSLVQQCRRELLQGNYAAFYTAALKAARVLMPADQALHSRIAASLERTRFSSEKPSAEDADHVLQQLERALKRST